MDHSAFVARERPLVSLLNGPWPGFVSRFDDGLVMGSARPASWILLWSHFDDREGHSVRYCLPEGNDCRDTLAKLMVADIDAALAANCTRREEFFLRVTIKGQTYLGASFVQRTTRSSRGGSSQEAIGVFGPVTETSAASEVPSLLQLVLTCLHLVSSSQESLSSAKASEVIDLTTIPREACVQIFSEVMDSIGLQTGPELELHIPTGHRVSVSTAESEVSLFAVWRPLLCHLHILWDALIQGASVVIVADSPSTCSQAVMSLKAFLHPYLGLTDLDYNPLITTFHPEFQSIMDHLRSHFHTAQRVVGGVNPLLISDSCTSPHVLFVNLATRHCPPRNLALLHETETDGLRSWLAGTFEPVVDHGCAGSLVLSGGVDALESVNNTTLRRWLLDSNASLLRPLLLTLDSRLEVILTDLELNPFRLLRRDVDRRWLPVDNFVESVAANSADCFVDFNASLWRGLKPKAVSRVYRNFLTRGPGKRWLAREETARKDTILLHRLNCLLKQPQSLSLPSAQAVFDVIAEVEAFEASGVTDAEREKLRQLATAARSNNPCSD